MQKNSERIKNRKLPDLMGFIVPVSIILLWFIVSKYQLISTYLLPPPGEILKSIWDFAFGNDASPYSGDLWINLLSSLKRVLSGFLLAAFLGLSLGYLCGRHNVLNRLISPFIHLIRAVPGIGWLPLALVWFGVGEKNTLFLITLAAFFPVFTNVVFSTSTINPRLILAGRMLGAKGLSLFTSVILPASFGGAAVGLRLSLGISWAYLVLGEMTGVSEGLGAVMMDARMLGRVDMVIVCIIIIAVTAKITDILLKQLFKIIPGGKVQ